MHESHKKKKKTLDVQLKYILYWLLHGANDSFRASELEMNLVASDLEGFSDESQMDSLVT